MNFDIEFAENEQTFNYEESININSGGASIAVDQTYNPESENAQSGKAVAEAVEGLKEYTDSTFTPFIKQTLSGGNSANDVSPIPHEVKVQLKSKNLLPYPFNVEMPYTQSGITVSDKGDGGIHIEGTFTGPSSLTFSLGTVTLPAGDYSLGGTIERTSVDASVSINVWFLDAISPTITLTEETATPICVQIGYYYDGTQPINADLYLAIQPIDDPMSPTYPTYTPYISDFSSISVVRHGEGSSDVVHYTANADGTVDGVTSISPTMGVYTSDTNVNLEWEYTMDIKLYIDNKFAELSAAILNS